MPISKGKIKKLVIQIRCICKTLTIVLQPFALLLAGLWGGMVFIYPTFIAPKSEPVPIVFNAVLSKPSTGLVDKHDTSKDLIPISLDINIENIGTRTLYSLPGIWLAIADKESPNRLANNINNLKETDFDSFKIRLLNAVNNKSSSVVNIFSCSSRALVVAGGSVIDNEIEIKPKEKISRTKIFYISSKEYNNLRITAYIAYSVVKDAFCINWQINGNYSDGKYTPSPIVFFNCKELDNNELNKYYSDKRYHLGMKVSQVTIALHD
jgi:hypothetical protein